MEKIIEGLIEVLDHAAGDPDLEDGADAEPGPEDDASAYYWSGGGDRRNSTRTVKRRPKSPENRTV